MAENVVSETYSSTAADPYEPPGQIIAHARQPLRGVCCIIRHHYITTPAQAETEQPFAADLGGLGSARAAGNQKPSLELGFCWSERLDLNQRPLAPQASALAKLSYAPLNRTCSCRNQYSRSGQGWQVLCGRQGSAIGRPGHQCRTGDAGFPERVDHSFGDARCVGVVRTGTKGDH